MKPTKKQVELAEKILKIEDKNILGYIESILSNVDHWEDELPEEIKKGIEEGLKDAEEGRVIPHAEVKKMYSKWLRK